MKESSSFKDVVKKVLTTEKKEVKPIPKAVKRKKKKDYVEEAIGYGGPSQPGNITPAYAGGEKGLPPFSKASPDGSTASVDMRDIGKEEDSKAKDNSRKPYPLENILDFIAHSGEDLQNARSMIEVSLRKNDVSLTKDQKKLLKDAEQTIKSSLGNITKAAKAINSINL